MVQHEGKLLAPKRSNKALWAAIIISLTLHLLFFWSSAITSSPEIKPPTQPVIFAKLRQEKPQQAQLKQARPQHEQSQHSQKTMQSPPDNLGSQSHESDIATSTAKTTNDFTPPSAADSKSSFDANKAKEKGKTKEKDLNQSLSQTSQPEASLANNQAEQQSGLAISKDLLSSDPLELEYQQKVLAHLRNNLLAPKHYSGSVRVEIRFSYRQIATDVRVVLSSGNPFFDDWAVKAILVANPFPPVPKELGDDYVFRPTLKVTP